MQTVECAIGNSFVINHESGTARVTVLGTDRNEVTLSIETAGEPGSASGCQTVTVAAEATGDILSILRARGR